MATRPAWSGRTARALSIADVSDLAADRIAYIRVPGYLSRDWCRELSRRFLEQPLDYHSFGIMKTRLLGLTVATLSDDRDAYFDRAPEINEALRRLYRGGEDPLLKLHRDMAACTGWKRFEASDEGRPYATDMVGALFPGAGVALHCDSPVQQPDPFSASFPCQWSWNVYLSTGQHGGKLILHRRAFVATDRRHDRGQEGFALAMLRGVERAQYQPSQGDLVLFNSAHFHEVRIVGGSTPRINAHSWMRLNPPRRSYGIWS